LSQLIYKRVLKKSALNDMLVDYPTPSNISYLWNFGSLAGICLGIQLATGIFLAMHYTPHVDMAFLSVEHIMRDVNYGWLIRYIHANGASMFLLVLYLHMFRGLYYSSYIYPRQLIWFSGVTIFLLTMGAAFLGYVLPWGQMSFWGATVITNLVSAIPVVGKEIVYWLWGGFSIDNATLNRFFSLHYLLPFVIAAIVGVHLIILHEPKSSNPLGVNNSFNKISFHPYFISKDLFGLIIFLIMYAYFVFFEPNMLGHSDNYILANPLVTPPHIVPEWYFLPFYAVLRSIPDKLGGVVAMVGSILILYILPVFHSIVNFFFYKKVNKNIINMKMYIKSATVRPIYRKLVWIFAINFIVLGWIGGCPVEEPFYTIGQVATILYFLLIIAMGVSMIFEVYMVYSYITLSKKLSKK
jgi:ubiquinol-cytochrome c reductase cytochrome b subunit